MAKFDSSTTMIRGINIYVDDQDRYVYYDPFTKRGYLLLDKNIKQFYFYQNRYLYVIIALILFTGFIANVYASLGFGIMAVIVLEYLFRVRYLNSLTILGNFKPVNKASTLRRSLNPETRGKMLIKSFLYTALSVLLVINAYIEQYELWLFVGTCAVAVVTIGIAIYNLVLGLKS